MNESVQEIIPIEIHEVPLAIRESILTTRPAAKNAARAAHSRNPRRIFLVGNGTSLYSSMAAAYTGRALTHTASQPFTLAMPAGDFRNYMPSLDEHDVVVGISASGEFRDLLAIFGELESRCLRIGITQVQNSSLSKVSDELLIAAGGPSNVPVMTKTYASTLTAAHVLLLEIFAAPGELYQELEKSAHRAESGLKSISSQLDAMVEALHTYQHAMYFGVGNAYPAALEAALKMKEMAMLHAEGSETWEYASGPSTIVDSKYFCVALSTGGGKDSDTDNSAILSRQWGARVIEIGPKSVANDWHVLVPSAVFEPFSTLSLVPPAALLAFRMARRRGHNPDQPHWRERYRAQGLNHLIGK